MSDAARNSDCVLVAVRVSVPPEKAFDLFTQDIGLWWRPDPLFQITPRGDGELAFEGGEGGRLVSRLKSGKVYEIGRVSGWRRGERLAFDWRQATFGPDLSTRVEVTFEPAGEETRVTVRHYGWTGVPREHVARHGFPDPVTQMRAAAWWRGSLDALARLTARPA
jgi:uncharacterized protein YndB with AHSA1/START domain